MNKIQIQVGDNVIELKFGYGVLRRLSEKWGINSVQGVFERFGSFQNKDEVEGEPEMGFDQLNIFGDIVWAAALTAGFEVDADDAVDVLMADPGKMGEIVLEFMKSLPQPTEEQKKTAAQVRKKPKK